MNLSDSQTLAPGILLYKNAIEDCEKIIYIANKNSRSWIIRNQNATDWESGNKIIGYDEYPISFSFHSDEKILNTAKNIFDYACNYANKNLTTINAFDSCVIRKYANSPGFLELESSDVENPQRKLTSILFLKDVDDGGELKFKNFDVSVSPKMGDIIVFPASFIYCFKINRPKNDDSYVLVSQFT